ncbi:hypothetical protein SAMN05192534_10151 [Alteribacillus persepolensis]|uniref:GAF domain-containing protein n=1 Tax=Alteribacillus persepolensis TaxID=568899 RepID=A0A1G7Y9W6_9BACI|nr:hypothetical protein [Alteribacillus persepolensis]SDG93177.1 hypothetical protein SAMN05192534_10151 [Alteribacillus persepolensis]
MNKSELLDEMRLEVGRAQDQAMTLDEFYQNVLQTFEHTWSFCDRTFILDYQWEYFNVIGLQEPKIRYDVKDTQAMYCAIHGKTASYSTIHSNFLCTPFYHNALLKGILVLKVNTESYVFQKEDVVFLEEVSRFLGTATLDFV